MYEARFGLKRRLFEGGIAQDADVFHDSKIDAVIAKFKRVLSSPDAVVTVSGLPGIGKTTLVTTALRATTTRLALAWLNGTPTNGAELMELLLLELGLNAHRSTRVERLQMWRQYLNEMSATESRLFIVIERAEDLSTEVLRSLDSLTAADPNGAAGVNVVLLGSGELDRHLAAPALASLCQRIRLRQRLEPFDQAELEGYLRHQVARAGGELSRVFEPDALATVYEYSRGIARVANNLCETALCTAPADISKLGASFIAEVATEMLGLAKESAATVGPARAADENAVPTPATTSAAAAPVVAPTSPPTAEKPPAPIGATEKPETKTSEPTAPTTVAPPTTQPPPPRASAIATENIARPAAPPPAAAEPVVQTAPPPVDADEYDGAATDIPDVAMIDFPVLTDAVEDAVEDAAPPPRPAVAAKAPTEAKPAPKPMQTPPPASATAPTSKVAAPVKPTAPAPAPKAPAAPAAAAVTQRPPVSTPRPPDDDPDADVLRQTQSMRAISVAKSIDDISNSMAETLFGEADLDMLSAALASAGWSDEEATAAAAPAPTKTEAPRETLTEPEEDPFDLFDLGPDMPLELLDDTPEAPSNDGPPRKIATQR